MKKVIHVVLVIVMICCMSLANFAAENEVPLTLQKGRASVLDKASRLLDGLSTTQVIVATEKEMIEKMIVDNILTKDELNQQLADLASEPVVVLENRGYNDEQIDVIKSYEGNEDAFEHVFPSASMTRTASSGAEVTFRYGLAGDNDQKSITIAYDMKWSSCPFFTFTDSFGIGWIAADSQSHEVITKTDSTMAQVNYYDPETDVQAGFHRNVEMDQSENGVVIGIPVIGSAKGNYGKHIGGVTQISTQSDSYNIETIHLFVAYAHTTIALSVDLEAVLEWNKVSGAISFIPRPRQDIIAQGDHTFRYDSEGEIIAEKL
ncbi:hypothetical protein ACR6HW_17545 [Fusibacter sp. JL298sf-3]